MVLNSYKRVLVNIKLHEKPNIPSNNNRGLLTLHLLLFKLKQYNMIEQLTGLDQVGCQDDDG